MLFQWSSVYRLIYTTGKPALHEGFDSWMGSSRGNRGKATRLVVARLPTTTIRRGSIRLAIIRSEDALKLTER